MADKSKSKSSKRSYLARKFVQLGQLRRGLPANLTYLQIAFGALIVLGLTLLLVEYEFQTIPDYSVGDIADRTIEAPQDFTIEDREATREKRAEVRATVPVIFELDDKLNSRVMSELRMAFGEARKLIEETRAEKNIPASRALPRSIRQELKPRLAEMLPRFDQGEVLDIALKYGFSEELENQLVQLLRSAMEAPVVLNRDALLRYQDRGILLRSSLTGTETPLKDWTAIRNLDQARDSLRQNEFELTMVSGEEKKKLINFLDSWLAPNVHFSEEATRNREQRALSEVDPVLTQVKKGKNIVRVGDEITEKKLQQLAELKKLKKPEKIFARLIGLFLVVGFFIFGLWLYFQVHHKARSLARPHFMLVVLVLFLSLFMTRVFMALGEMVSGSLNLPSLQNPIHFYLFAPLAMGAILVMLLIGVDSAILFSVVFAVFAGLLTGEPTIFVYALTGSLAGVYILEHYRERSAIIRAGFVIGAVNIVIALALQLYSSGFAFQWNALWVRSCGGLVAGLVAAMLTALMLPILESLFGMTTDIRLLELSNLNSPILRRLAVEAPGTYHHSIIVGTLAEAGAEAISANALLVRVAAYYHDIGKLRHPEYYVENQIYCANKHESLSPTMSSLILASHVKDGLAIAEEINLAPGVREMIPQHHGTRLMTYFYQKAKETSDEKNSEVRESDFRYPGPKPASKEAAILMLADQVEAAARTLQDPSPGQIRGLIERLIQSTIQDGQFDECDITIRELNKVSGAFERILTGMYHHRIEYPGFDFNKQVEGRRPENQRIQ